MDRATETQKYIILNLTAYAFIIAQEMTYDLVRAYILYRQLGNANDSYKIDERIDDEKTGIK